tara:strand:+ start:2483 stop:2881 length:399 start_codon:yes stop_codon:yes gene_type:complete
MANINESVTQIITSGQGKSMIEQVVKDFICQNDKIFTPVVEHINAKVDEAFSNANVDVIFDKFVNKIRPCDIKNCLTECLSQKKNPQGVLNNAANMMQGAVTGPASVSASAALGGTYGGKFNKTRKRRKGKK